MASCFPCAHCWLAGWLRLGPGRNIRWSWGRIEADARVLLALTQAVNHPPPGRWLFTPSSFLFVTDAPRSPGWCPNILWFKTVWQLQTEVEQNAALTTTLIYQKIKQYEIKETFLTISASEQRHNLLVRLGKCRRLWTITKREMTKSKQGTGLLSPRPLVQVLSLLAVTASQGHNQVWSGKWPVQYRTTRTNPQQATVNGKTAVNSKQETVNGKTAVALFFFFFFLFFWLRTEMQWPPLEF